MVQLVVRIPKSTKIALELEAARSNQNLSQITRKAIQKHLKVNHSSDSNSLLKLASISKKAKPRKNSPAIDSQNYKQHLYKI